MDSEHAADLVPNAPVASGSADQAPDDTEISLNLDPVGVFLHSSEAVAGGIFSGLMDLLRTSEAADPSEQDADVPAESSQVSTKATHQLGAREVQRRKCTRDRQPLDEYTHNAELLYGAFWYLFPLRAGLRRRGPVAVQDSRHMFTQFHNLFAQRHNFLFLMTNQVQRHAAARGVALRVKTDPWSFKAFAEIVADADVYMEKLRRAQEDPTSKEARELLMHVMRFVSSARKVVPWSGEERAGEMTKLYTMSRRFGTPSGFLTVAPDDVHQATGIRLSYRAGCPDVFPSCAGMLLPILRGEASCGVGSFLC